MEAKRNNEMKNPNIKKKKKTTNHPSMSLLLSIELKSKSHKKTAQP